MTGIAIFFLITTVIFMITTAAVTIIALRYARVIMSMEDRFDEALEALDVSFREIGAILQRPVMFDSPEIRRVIASLRRSQQAVLLVANKITRVSDEDDADDEETDE